MIVSTRARFIVQRLALVRKIAWNCRSCATSSSPTSPADVLIGESRIIPTTFSNGLFTFKLDHKTYVLHYWTPVSQLPEVMQLAPGSKVVSDPLAPSQDEQVTVSLPSVTVIDVTNTPIDLKASPVALGHALGESSTILVNGIDEKPISLQLDGMVDPVRKWAASEAPPKAFGDQVLMKQKQAILNAYLPLSDQFTQILTKAESQAQSRFKWGGLFFLSAQLGFVARLTWFEYSWDIMEPITWCITYSLMISTFAYYVMTSQEFLLPLAEKREVRERFWKIAQKNNFNVKEFKRLRKQLLDLERQCPVSGGSQTAFDRVMRSMQF